MIKVISLLIIMMMSIASESQKYVVVEVKSESAEVQNDVPFFLLVNMKPDSGIHINIEPPISVKQLDSQTTLSVKRVSKSGEYLDWSKPIELECKVEGVPAGPHKLSFAVNYTYCSEKEGWCRMGKDTVSVTVRVKK